MTKLDWMHPSYRDLLIDELASEKKLRDPFLRTANLKDIGLAFSTQGGENGKRALPLIVDDDSKRIIEQRIVEIIPDLTIHEQLGLFYIIESSIKEKGSNIEWIISLLCQLLSSLRTHWQERPINLPLLTEFCNLSLYLKPLPQLPDFERTWNYQIDLLKNAIEEEGCFSGSEIGDWAKLISLLKKNEPRFLTQINFPDSFSSLISEIIKNLESDVTSSISPLTIDIMRNEIDRITEIIDGLEELCSVVSGYQREITFAKYSLSQKRDEFVSSILEELEPDLDDIDDYLTDPTDFDINQLFSDL